MLWPGGHAVGQGPQQVVWHDDSKRRYMAWQSPRSGLGIGIHRHFTTPDQHPYDTVDVGAAGRPDHQLRHRGGRLRAARRGGSLQLERQRHQHPGPEVLPGHPRHRPSGSGRSSRWSTGWWTPSPGGGARTGTSSTTRRPRRFGDELKYLIIHQKAAFNSPVWFNIGVAGGAPAGIRLLHPGRRRLDGLHPQLVHRGGDHLQGWVRARGSTCRRSVPPGRDCAAAARPRAR